MYDAVKETPQCTHCVHKEVCKHKQDFLDIWDAILNCSVCRENRNGTTLMPIKNFDCFGEIDIKCKYYQYD